MGEWIVAAVLAGVVALILRRMWKNRGKNVCSGDCSQCRGCGK